MATTASDAPYAVFAQPAFDANDYANAILAGEPFPAQHDGQAAKGNLKTTTAQQGGLELGKEDISVAISKLNVGLEDITKQLRSVVTNHHEALLVQAASVNDFQSSLGSVSNGLDEVTASLNKLQVKVRVPYQGLEQQVTRLEKLQLASDILRRTGRFIIVARRLEFQMKEIQRAEQQPTTNGKTTNGKEALTRTLSGDILLSDESEKERAIAKAALSIAELVSLLDAPVEASLSSADGEQQGSASDPIPLRAIRGIASHIPAIEAARTKVTTEMESMVLTGLSTLNQSLLASSLQTAYNLRVLPDLVQSLVADLTDAIQNRIMIAFDLNLISKDVSAKEPATTSQGLLYKSRVRTEPTNVTAPQWTAVLWNRLESLVEEMAGCCIKVYTLETVLRLKRDTVTQQNFLDEAMKLLENKPSSTFWTVMARALERQCRESARASSFLQQTLSTGYPRLLRLFQDFFAKISVHTDTAYSADKQSPETILTLKALSNFESLYLSRSTNRLNESIAQAFVAGSRSPPGMPEGVSIARTMANELDSAKFDPLLLKGIAKNVQAALDLFLIRADSLVVKDRWATNLIGPVGTPQPAVTAQTTNAQVATCLYHCSSRLQYLEDEYAAGVFAIINPGIKNVYEAYQRVVEPLLAAVGRELDAILARLHRVDLARSSDGPPTMGATSPYMKDFVEKLSFIKTQVLGRFNVAEESREWVKTIAKNALQTFVLHASIAKPLGESGKLQLTSDMTEFEFALSAFMVEDAQHNKRGGKLDVIGDEYKALRAMRPLLFLDNRMLTSPQHTAGLSPIVVLHHILVRSPLPLPHAIHGWQEAEYVRWVAGHSQEEALTLIEGGITHWEKVTASGDDGTPRSEVDAGKEYVSLAREVLAGASGKFSYTG